jgi:GTP-binding protein
MIIKSAEFIKSAVKSSHYPVYTHPEIAFAGRSNVGKSSLINTLVNRKRLVKTSSTPGRTQLINFFIINDTFGFVDLPGYGYAKVPKAVRKTWGPMIETYLSTRENLRGVVLLMDIRRTPDEKDYDLINWLTRFDIPVVLVLTKADKLSKSKRKLKYSDSAADLCRNDTHPVLFSAKTRMGKDELWSRINLLLSDETPDEGGP